MHVLLIVVCPFVLFLLAIVLSVLLRYTDSDCPFGIFKLFLNTKQKFKKIFFFITKCNTYCLMSVITSTHSYVATVEVANNSSLTLTMFNRLLKWFIFFWPLSCLFFFDIRILINPLVSSNSSLLFVHNVILSAEITWPR
jgi:hypothetical protein